VHRAREEVVNGGLSLLSHVVSPSRLETAHSRIASSFPPSPPRGDLCLQAGIHAPGSQVGRRRTVQPRDRPEEKECGSPAPLCVRESKRLGAGALTRVQGGRKITPSSCVAAASLCHIAV
jgi:hypothetical protein